MEKKKKKKGGGDKKKTRGKQRLMFKYDKKHEQKQKEKMFLKIQRGKFQKTVDHIEEGRNKHDTAATTEKH